VPDLPAKITAARELRARGYTGLLSATHLYPEERAPIIEAGCDVTYNYYTEAGVGFARHTYETLRPSPVAVGSPPKPEKARVAK
jgi:glutathione-regulated potassium-efflux system ancillary protein KefC